MSTRRLPIVLGLVSLLPWFSVSNQHVRAAVFIPLGDLQGGDIYSVPFAIPADSKAMVVVGLSSSALGTEAFYWTPAGGMVGLGDLPDGEFYSAAFGVSVDGSVVVGAGTSSSGVEAFRWKEGQMTGLGDLPGGEFRSGAWDVSVDGSVIVGASDSALSRYGEAFRREGEEVMTGLGDLPGSDFDSRAVGVSNNVLVIVGSSASAASGRREEAFRWEGGVMTGLGDLPGGHFKSNAWAASPDGSVIVGTSHSGSGPEDSPLGLEAFRWEGGQMTGLGDLPGGQFNSIAYSVSGDGSVIVGTGSSAASDRPYNEAFIWNPVNGMLGLQNVLEDRLGLDLAGWRLTSARDISFDSRVITGEGINPDGNREAWLVQSLGNPFGPISESTPFFPNPYPFPELPPIPDPFPTLPDFPFPIIPEARTWIAGEGQGDTLIWSDGNNWDGGGIGPQANWDIQLDNQKVTTGQTVIVDADTVVHSIDINGIGGTMIVVVKENVRLDVLDGITVGPGGILKGAGTVVGDITNLGGTVIVGFPEPSGMVLVALGLVGLVCWFPDPTRRP